MRLYLLNHAHPDGAAKARFFARFGYSDASLPAFVDALIDHAGDNDIAERAVSRFGTKYVVICNVKTPDGRDPCIVTVWIDQGSGEARLVTAYPR